MNATWKKLEASSAPTGTSASARIAVVDDMASVRNSLKALLETYDYDVETYESADAFFDAISDRSLSCVLLDVVMPGMDGLAAQRLLANRAPGLPAIIITGHGDIDMAVRALKEGAFDFIEKPIDDAKLVASVASAVNRAVEAKAAEKERGGAVQKYNHLTKREQDVFRLVVDGYSRLAIASTLSISARTVDHHRDSIYAKMEATSLSHLIRMAQQIGERS